MLSAAGTKNFNILLCISNSELLLPLKKKLEKDFIVTSAESMDALEKFLSNEDMTQLVLLDKNFPNADGVETTELLKNNSRHKDVPVIFLTEKQSLEDIDINDSVCMTYDEDDLASQIKLTINFHEKIREQNQIIDETRKMAFSAMSQSGEIGQILHFMRDSFECNTLEKLGLRIMESMESQFLNTVVRFNSNPPVYFSHETEVARLDKEILDRLHILERIVDFGIRSLYNFEHVSILVKNMPLDDADKYGRIKDNVCLILEAADAKIIGINNDAILQARDQSISRVIESSKRTLKEIEAAFQDNAEKNAEIMLKLKEKIEWSFVQLGLNETQEHEIAEIVRETELNSSALYESGLKIEDRLAKLTSELNEITNNSKSN